MMRTPKIKGIKDPFSISPSEMNWRDRAVCSNQPTDKFFATPKSCLISSALAICKTCPVRSDCFYEAMQYNYDGVWGGSTYEQRLVLMRTILKSDLTDFTREKSDALMPYVDNIGITKNTALSDIINNYDKDNLPNV